MRMRLLAARLRRDLTDGRTIAESLTDADGIWKGKMVDEELKFFFCRAVSCQSVHLLWFIDILSYVGGARRCARLREPASWQVAVSRRWRKFMQHNLMFANYISTVQIYQKS